MTMNDVVMAGLEKCATSTSAVIQGADDVTVREKRLMASFHNLRLVHRLIDNIYVLLRSTLFEKTSITSFPICMAVTVKYSCDCIFRCWKVQPYYVMEIRFFVIGIVPFSCYTI